MKRLLIVLLLCLLLASCVQSPRPKASSSGLPPGITLNPQGTLVGTPTVPGAYTFTVKVQDAVGSTATAAETLNVYQVGDINSDFAVNVLDMILVGQNFGTTGTPGWIAEDINRDGSVNVLDMILIGQHFGQ